MTREAVGPIAPSTQRIGRVLARHPDRQALPLVTRDGATREASGRNLRRTLTW